MHSNRIGFRSVWAVALCLAALVLQPALEAQVTTATVYGRVVDPSGAVIPGASISASNEGTGVELSTVTGAGGEFTIPFLPAGTYSLAITADGFKSYLEDGTDAGFRPETQPRLRFGTGRDG